MQSGREREGERERERGSEGHYSAIIVRGSGRGGGATLPNGAAAAATTLVIAGLSRVSAGEPRRGEAGAYVV